MELSFLVHGSRLVLQNIEKRGFSAYHLRLLSVVPLQPFFAPFSIVEVLVVAAQTLLKCYPWVKGDLLERVSEPSVARCAVRVSPRAVCLVVDRLGACQSACELECHVWRPIYLWKEGTWFVLLARLLHGAEASVVVVNVRVSSRPVDVVLHASEAAIVTRMSSFFRCSIAHIPIYSVHLALFVRYLLA